MGELRTRVVHARSAFVGPTPTLRWRAPRPATCARRTLIIRASQSLPDGYSQAVIFAEAGDFKSAARVLEVDAEMRTSDSRRREAVRKLLNPITLETLNSNDDAGVVALYSAMQSKGLLRNFGAAPVATNNSSRQDKSVSVESLVSKTGIPLSALAPKRSSSFLSQFAGVAAVFSVFSLARYLGVESYANIFTLLVATGILVDQTFLRGSISESIYDRINPSYGERIVKHEAGHFLVGYLGGLSISGYVLSGREALKSKLPSGGQGGTLFYDAQMTAELQSGRVSPRTIDRYSCVLMAGIAAEAVQLGQAEGGLGDEAGLIQLLSQINPPWPPELIKSQARWAVLQSIILIRDNAAVYDALVDAMRERKPLGDCINRIEEASIVTQAPPVAQEVPVQPVASAPLPDTAQTKRAAEERTAAIDKRLTELDEKLADLYGSRKPPQ